MRHRIMLGQRPTHHQWCHRRHRHRLTFQTCQILRQTCRTFQMWGCLPWGLTIHQLVGPTIHQLGPWGLTIHQLKQPMQLLVRVRSMHHRYHHHRQILNPILQIFRTCLIPIHRQTFQRKNHHRHRQHPIIHPEPDPPDLPLLPDPDPDPPPDLPLFPELESSSSSAGTPTQLLLEVSM